MSLSVFESRQHRNTFFQAGHNAFLIGVPRENNPYKESLPRSAWDKGYMLTKVNYRASFYAEVKLAEWLGYPLPRKPEFRRAAVGTRVAPRVGAVRPTSAPRPSQGSTLDSRTVKPKRLTFDGYQRGGGNFRIENAR